MAVDVSAPRSRRAILAGTLGALGATIASALGRATPASATNGGSVVLGNSAAAPLDGTGINEASATTAIHTTTGIGLRAQTAAIDKGLYGYASNTGAGTNYGVHGRAMAASGRGVFGDALHATGANYGVYGNSSSNVGVGVRGNASTLDGATRGVHGTVTSNAGVGVRGDATNTGGVTTGVEGVASSIAGRGVVGRATAASGGAYGVIGESASASGIGVRGTTTATSGNPTGVWGTTVAMGGTGVLGTADGTGTGVRGRSDSGIAIRGEANSPTGGYGVVGSAGGIGVQGTSDGIDGIGVRGAASTSTSKGVIGVSSGGDGFGVVGHSNNHSVGVMGFSASAELSLPDAGGVPVGVYGRASQANARGVRGIASSVTGATVGVEGHVGSTEGVGVLGLNEAGGLGVLGISAPDETLPILPANTGIYGYAAKDASSRGILGESTTGRGVSGKATSGSGIRGFATTGVALYGSTGGLKSGVALETVGKVKFGSSVGLATVPMGQSSVTVTPGIDVTATTAVVATLQGSAGGTTTVHRVVIDPGADTFTIHLTANATSAVGVAWHAFG